MSDDKKTTSPSSGNGGIPAGCTTAGCPLGNLIVHVRKDTASGSAISNATVNISGPESSSGSTDATDKAIFNKIKPGSYTVTARKDAHAPDPKSGTVSVPTGGTAEITLILAEDKVVQIKAKLPGTNGVRKPTTDKRPDNLLTASTTSDESLAVNTPVILVRGCKEVELEAITVPPNKPVSWTVKANENNDAPPTITPIDGGKKAKLKSNIHGSFSVIATLGTSKIVWNVVFVWIKVDVNSTSVTTRDNKYADSGSGGGSTGFRSGQFSAGNYAWEATVKLKVVGGGTSKRLGTDKVAVHILQNGVTDTLMGHYAPPPAGATALEVPKGGLPIVDATSAASPFITNPTAGKVTPNNTGFERTAWTGDSPAGGFPTAHINTGNALQSINGVNGFQTAIAAVSNQAPNSIIVCARIAWSADYSGSVSGVGVYTRTTAKTRSDARFQRVSDATGGQDAENANFETFEPRFNGGTDTTWTP